MAKKKGSSKKTVSKASAAQAVEVTHTTGDVTKTAIESTSKVGLFYYHRNSNSNVGNTEGTLAIENTKKENVVT